MIVAGIIGLLATIAVPSFLRARNSAQVKTCFTNLRAMDAAKVQWAIDSKKKDTDVPVAADVTPYLKTGLLPQCPAGGTYRLRRVSRYPTCTLYPDGHTLNNLNLDDDALPD